MGAGNSQEAVQVCYGGIFSGSVRNINRTDPSVWKNIEMSLSRGNIVQLGQYAERSWAPLISTPLQPYQLEALLDKADVVHMSKNSHHGALLRRPKLFIHIGAEGTSSTELLTESLVDKIELLESDGYKVAVHGKYDGKLYTCTRLNAFFHIFTNVHCILSFTRIHHNISEDGKYGFPNIDRLGAR